ncbi:hypothetical protein RI367_002040 [Sorochytrium milnesiophthora]
MLHVQLGLNRHHFWCGSRSKSRAVTPTVVDLRLAPSTTASAPDRGNTGDEYVRKLQQQIYLLELEVQYLYVSLWSSQLKDAEDKSTRLEQAVQDLQQDKSALTQSLEQAKESHRAGRERANAELFAQTRKAELADERADRASKAAEQLQQEKLHLQTQLIGTQSSLQRAEGQVQELLALNAKLKQNVDDECAKSCALKVEIQAQLSSDELLNLRADMQRYKELLQVADKDKAQLQAQLKHIEMQQKYDAELKTRMANDAQELLKTNAAHLIDIQRLQSQLIDVQERQKQRADDKQDQLAKLYGIKEEVRRLKDENQLQVIDNESKRQKIDSLERAVSASKEAAEELKATIARLHDRLSEKDQTMAAVEERLASMHKEQIAALERSTDLQDQLDVAQSKLRASSTDNAAAQREIQGLKSELASRRELEQLLQHVEQSGDQYARAMNHIKDRLRGDTRAI